MNKLLRKICVLASVLLVGSATGESPYETYLTEGTFPSLKEAYAGRLDIGVPAEVLLNADESTAGLITSQCGLLICEETCRGKNLLDRSGSKKKKDPEQARLVIGKAEEALDSAQDKGMKVRAATVIQAGNTPEWFFTQKWEERSGAEKADRETMIRRMENVLRDQMEKMNVKYPGLISEWEVVRFGASGEEDPFRTAIGEDYPVFALEFARKYAAEGQKLLVYVPEIPDGEILLQFLEWKKKGLLDGVVLKCSFSMDTDETRKLENALELAAQYGLEIHLSGLEIPDTDRTASGQIRLAARYRWIFSMSVKPGFRSVSFAELRDKPGRDKKTPPRLFNEKGNPTPSFFGALQDGIIPMPGNEEAVRAAVENLDLDTRIKKEADPVISYKKAGDHNPVMTQRFGADPWAMVYNDRVYLYMTGDEPAASEGEKPKTNDYSNIVTLRVLSSDDLVNWEDHGSVRAAGRTGAAAWATNSWAPCAAWKNMDGKDRFFLYFANSGGGIGVLSSDSPAGPFTDPIGKPLISRSTPTCESVTWLFDPAVLTDEDGEAYLYFGGGIPEGKQADPGTARVVKLGKDMISLDGEPVQINPPWLFEDSGINRFGDTYVYSYCSNFSVPPQGSAQGFGSGEIVYMTSDGPTGPFTYAGQVLKNPGVFFGTGGNNHHSMFCFRDQWYITYHAATIDRAMGWNAGYRSTFVDVLELNEKGLPAPSKGTYSGVAQLKAFDPFQTVQGATAVSMAGMTTELVRMEDRKAGTGPMAAVSLTPGAWICVAGADFGMDGASSIRMTVRSEVPARVEILADGEEGKPIVSADVPACETDTTVTAELSVPLTGTHDLYFRFTESGTSLLEWQFQ